MTPNLLPCDLVLVQGTGWVSRQILKATQSYGEDPSEVSHVGLVIQGGVWDEALIAEAVNKVRVGTVPQFYRTTDSLVGIWRPKDLTFEDEEAILKRAVSRIGTTYGYGKIGLQLADSWLGKIARRDVYAFRRFGASRWPICSGLVAECFQAAGLGFGVPVGRATPDDIHDFCVARPDKYVCIRPLKEVE